MSQSYVCILHVASNKGQKRIDWSEQKIREKKKKERATEKWDDEAKKSEHKSNRASDAHKASSYSLPT